MSRLLALACVLAVGGSAPHECAGLDASLRALDARTRVEIRAWREAEERAREARVSLHAVYREAAHARARLTDFEDGLPARRIDELTREIEALWTRRIEVERMLGAARADASRAREAVLPALRECARSLARRVAQCQGRAPPELLLLAARYHDLLGHAEAGTVTAGALAWIGD